MIQFPCRCSHVFTLENDRAGGTIQCPKCGILNDIPLHSDLEHLNADGTFKIEAPPPPGHVIDPSNPLAYQSGEARVDELRRAFARGTTDYQGNELDLRPTMADVLKAGHAEMPYELREQVGPDAPKYDPETGELIRPMDVKPGEEAGGAVPMARRAVTYAGSDLAGVATPSRIFLEMFQPTNVIVMFFTFLFYVLGQVAFTSLILVIVVLPVAFLLLSHYGNVIDETGPEAHDELPRPLRGMDWHDDIGGPAFRMLVALVVCYAPAAVIISYTPPGLRLIVGIVSVVMASLFVPAAMLTTTTSGTILNLRPDRLLRVIGTSGALYFLAVVVWIIAAALHIWTFIGIELIPHSLPRTHWIYYFNHPLIIYPLLITAIYLMHYVCWLLGLMYRQHHHEFPWILQRHVPVRLQERLTSGLSPGSAPPVTHNPPSTISQYEQLRRDPRNQRRQPES